MAAATPTPESHPYDNAYENLRMFLNMDSEQLTATNFPGWEATLNYACVCADAKWVLKNIPVNYVNMSTNQKDKTIAAVRKAIRKTIPDDIQNLMPTNALAETPDKILQTLRGLLADDSDAVHRRLEAEAKLTLHNPGQQMLEYINFHRNLRRRMCHSAYPNISKKHTSVRFAVNGLEFNPTFREAARAIRLPGLPPTLKILDEQLSEE